MIEVCLSPSSGLSSECFISSFIIVKDACMYLHQACAVVCVCVNSDLGCRVSVFQDVTGVDDMFVR